MNATDNGGDSIQMKWSGPENGYNLKNDDFFPVVKFIQMIGAVPANEIYIKVDAL